MELISTPRAMQAWAERIRGTGERIGFVPTMGFLHEGHISLVGEARQRAERCVVSIFVNPLQFGANEDLERYPRDLDRDADLLRAAEVDVLYTPSAAVMYPEGFQTEVNVMELTQGLCGAARPRHFRGVTTVVAKLFNTVKPHVAVFGMKDFQQLVAVRRMASDLDFDLEIIGGPIVREADGVAMSSRNAYLTAEERRAARCVSRALAEGQEVVSGGERHAANVVAAACRRIAAEPMARIDYVELVDPVTMRAVDQIDGGALLAIAVFIGRIRLIDNTLLRPA